MHEEYKENKEWWQSTINTRKIKERIRENNRQKHTKHMSKKIKKKIAWGIYNRRGNRGNNVNNAQVKIDSLKPTKQKTIAILKLTIQGNIGD